MKENNGFSKDFWLVVIGQIISLFGNAILRFALPMHLLNVTGSAALFGVISACSFIPMVLLSPIGGILADRVNKRNVMVILDFSTAGIMLVYTLLFGKLDIIIITFIVLILLYGITGAYQPTVQASIPVLTGMDHLMQANAVINLVASMAGLVGPVLGGVFYGTWGLFPILIISVGCFLFSAVMELFIHIPFEKKKEPGGIIQIAVSDLKESVVFIREEKPVIGKLMLLVALFNCFMSALMIVGLPVLVIQVLDFGVERANQMSGLLQGILGLGGLTGGLLTGVLAKKLVIEKNCLLLLASSILLIPMGVVLRVGLPDLSVYVVMCICSFLIMVIATMFTVQVMSYVQMIVPGHLLGKVVSCILAVTTCAQPLGQAMYGILFNYFIDHFIGHVWLIIIGSAVISSGIALSSRRLFRNIRTVTSSLIHEEE